MERPKLFPNGILPEYAERIKKETEELMTEKRERITKYKVELNKLEEEYNIELANPNRGNVIHIRDKILELRILITKREIELERYGEDPSRDWGVHKIELEEIKRKIMEEMGYSPEALAYMDEEIASLKKEQ